MCARSRTPPPSRRDRRLAPNPLKSQTPCAEKRPEAGAQSVKEEECFQTPCALLTAWRLNDLAVQSSIAFTFETLTIEALAPSTLTPDAFPLRVALGGDHAGFSLKAAVAERFGPMLTRLIDCGTDSDTSCDYPDFAVSVAREIVRGNADRGIVVCGSGVGVSVAANKIPGIRAAICHDTYSAHQGVEHDDMNVLCIGGRIIGSELAFEIIAGFLAAKYQPAERHARRLAKVLEIEKRGLDALG